ncbi:MAG: GNAT family N-acetyltransferase [Candidatus Acidiferrales bacterium]
MSPLEIGDAEQAQLIFPQWEIVRFMNSRYIPWPYPADGALAYYRDVALPAIERGEEWHWTLRLKGVPQLLIGSISLRKREGHNRGFWLGLGWHGKGLMTEAVDAVTDYWFDVLGFPVLRASKAAANVASRRISERTGMRVIVARYPQLAHLAPEMPAAVNQFARHHAVGKYQPFVINVLQEQIQRRDVYVSVC